MKRMAAVQPNTILWRHESPLTALLLLDRDWCGVYADEAGYRLFVRREFFETRGDLQAEDCPREAAAAQD